MLSLFEGYFLFALTTSISVLWWSLDIIGPVLKAKTGWFGLLSYSFFQFFMILGFAPMFFFVFIFTPKRYKEKLIHDVYEKFS